MPIFQRKEQVRITNYDPFMFKLDYTLDSQFPQDATQMFRADGDQCRKLLVFERKPQTTVRQADLFSERIDEAR